jgi:hypothetical protein
LPIEAGLESQVLLLALFCFSGRLPTTEREGDNRRLSPSSETTSVVVVVVVEKGRDGKPVGAPVHHLDGI